MIPPPSLVRRGCDQDIAAVIANSPANPTGAVQSMRDMEGFADIAGANDVLCMSDEGHGHFVFKGNHNSPMEFT